MQFIIINYCLDNRGDFKTLTIINGARSSKDLVYKEPRKGKDGEETSTNNKKQV